MTWKIVVKFSLKSLILLVVVIWFGTVAYAFNASKWSFGNAVDCVYCGMSRSVCWSGGSLVVACEYETGIVICPYRAPS